MASLLNIKKELQTLADAKQAKILQGFFKTGPGEYGEGDIFLGIKVPIQRRIAEKYTNLKFIDIKKLLKSKIHEERLVALLILVSRFQDAKQSEQKKIYDFYLKNTKKINNWDLVDLSAPQIVGIYLLKRPKKILLQLATSKNLWERRIAVVATLAFIKDNNFTNTINLAKILLNDEHDLIHKAVGWMLREVGKRDEPELRRFLDKYTLKMPRTMLRYAIERLAENERQMYLKMR